MKPDKFSTLKKVIPQIIVIWTFLRTLTSLAAAIFSSLRPDKPIEQQIALWPPSQDFLAWLNRVFLAPWPHYDAIWFEHILTHGYMAGDGSTAFHPLYILLSYPLYRLGVNATFSLLITSTLATLAFMVVFYQFVELDHGSDIAWTALLLMVTFPVAFLLFAPYTESVFLLWSAATFYWIRQKHWGWAAFFSFLAALTRQQGIFLILPIAWGIWESSAKNLSDIWRNWRTWLSTLPAPAGFFAWALFRIGYLHEGSLDMSNIQGLIYSAFLSPSNQKISPGQGFRLPWDALTIAISKTIHAPDLSAFINLGLGIWFLIAFFVAWKYLNIGERLYSLVIILVSFSFSTTQYVYISLPKHLFVAIPIFIGMAAALQKHQKKQLLLAFQMLGMLFLIYCYVLNGWIP